jgi:hypothetical protein
MKKASGGLLTFLPAALAKRRSRKYSCTQNIMRQGRKDYSTS